MALIYISNIQYHSGGPISTQNNFHSIDSSSEFKSIFPPEREKVARHITIFTLKFELGYKSKNKQKKKKENG